MPVRSAETMISSHFDNIQWSDTSSLYLEDVFENKLLEDPAEALFPNFDTFDSGNIDFSDLITAPSSPKYQIRHHDCMWSGTCVDKSHPSKKKGVNLCSVTAVMSQQQSDNTQKSTESNAVKVVTQKNIMTPNNIMKTIMCKNNNINGTKLSAGGRSLLINNNSNINNNNQTARINTNTAALTQSKMHQQNHKESKSIEGRHELDSIMNASIVNLRPDTPLSLGDDVPELKHNIDLTPCPSSNRMKFSDPNSIKIINALAEHLEDTSNGLNEPVNSFMTSFRNRSSPSDLNEILTDITFLSDYEDLADDSSIIDIDDDDQLDEHDYKDNSTLQKMFTSNILSQASQSRTTINHHEFISDHSYTRPKGSRYDALGVQTPSDSGESSLIFLFLIY